MCGLVGRYFLLIGEYDLHKYIYKHTYRNNVETSCYHFVSIPQVHTASFKGYFRQAKNFGNTEHLSLITSSPLLCWVFFLFFMYFIYNGSRSRVGSYNVTKLF